MKHSWNHGNRNCSERKQVCRYCGLIRLSRWGRLPLYVNKDGEVWDFAPTCQRKDTTNTETPKTLQLSLPL